MRDIKIPLDIINLYKNIICIIIFFFLFNFSVEAQKITIQNENNEKGKISGRMIDSISGQPIEYATIGLFTQVGNKVVNGATTNEKGIFKMTNIAEGSYKLVIDFIGYKKCEKNNVVISKKNKNIVLGDIKLSSKQTTLNEVTITAEKSLIENKIDKLIYNADKDISAQTGVASDILKKVPQVSVDVNGNVELQGNSNIKFLINGKPSVLFGSNISDVLQSIPASQIQTIEVITSPGAKYDAEGTGGIINIVLKHNNANGINGNVSLSAGTRMENGSFNLNIRKGKFGVNAYLNGNGQLPATQLNSSNRISSSSDTISKLNQVGSSEVKRSGFQSGLGFDWDLTPKDNISGNFNFNYFGVSNDGGSGRQSILDASGMQLYEINDSTLNSGNFHVHSFDLSLNYKKKFSKKDQELNVSISTSSANRLSYYDQTQEYISPLEIYNASYGSNPGLDKETNISFNYNHPYTDDIIFETGAKATFDNINSNSEVYLRNGSTSNYEYSTTQSTLVNYTRNIYAAYLSATFKMFKFLDIKAGIRDEYTYTKADFSNEDTLNIKPYNTLVPSLVLSHNFKDNQTLKISYSYRISRPDYRDLNPFINASDPKNISTGNPNLQPETNNKIELSYNQTFSKGTNLNLTLFYRGNRDDIQSYTNYYPTYRIGDSVYTNVAVSTRQNIGREDNYGFNIYVSIPIKEKINIRTNISGYQRYIYTGLPTGGDIQGFNYRANLNATYQMTKTLVIELYGNYNSPRTNAQGTMPSFYNYSFALRKQFFNKNASIALTANNFINNYVDQKTDLTGPNFSITSLRQMPFRSFGINLTYKFGHLEFKKEREVEDQNLSNPQGL